MFKSFDGIKEKAKNVTVGLFGAGAAVLAPVSVFAADGASTTTSLSSVITADSISGVMTEITSLLPVILPTIIGFMAFRKGWTWFKGQIKGA